MQNQAKFETKYLTNYEVPQYLVEELELHIELQEQNTKVRSVLSIRSNNDKNSPLILNGENQELISIRCNDQELSASAFQKCTDKVIIPNVPNHFKLEVISIIQPQNNTALSGLYRSKNMFCTQCEPEGFRAITYYPDRPDVMAKFTTTIIGDRDKYPVMLSNGNLIQQGLLENNRHFVVWEDPFKKPSYLFALVAGQLTCVNDVFLTHTKKEVRLELYVEPGNENKCQFALDSLKKAMRWDEEVYGLEYDLDIYMIVAVNDFNMGAMENKGLNIFNAKYVLANKETATDKDFQNVEAVIGHEYFHNWTGNRVTCRDWFQLSLKEGLTVFREQQFCADSGAGVTKRIEDVQAIRSRQFLEDRGPMAHPVKPQSYIEINNFYTMTVYYKGSEVIRMIHTLLGKENFRKGMDLYFERFDGQAVTTEDFVQAMQDASSIDLTQFKRWYYQAGTPVIAIQTEYKQGKFLLTLQQSCPLSADKSPKKPFYIPVKMHLLNREGKTIQAKSKDIYKQENGELLLILKEPSQTYTFTDIPEPPIPSFFCEFSAPVIYHYAYTTQELLTLIMHDTDAFNRWDAMQNLLSQTIRKILHEQNFSLNTIEEAFKQILKNHADPGVIAEMLQLPSIEYLGESFEVIPIGVLIESREQLQNRLAITLKDSLLDTYHYARSQNRSEVPSQWRHLKNQCLYLLAQAKTEDILEICIDQLNSAENMTDSLGALVAMNDFRTDKRDYYFQQFYNKWQHDPLVVNKWFALEATQNVPSVLEKIMELKKHPAFDMHNPNNVYALFGSFSKNPQFHDVNGKAYDFLADQIIFLNGKNPQIASRMVENLSLWKRFDNPHQQLMKSALVKISHQDLSNDVYEIVMKSLA